MDILAQACLQGGDLTSAQSLWGEAVCIFRDIDMPQAVTTVQERLTVPTDG